MYLPLQNILYILVGFSSIAVADKLVFTNSGLVKGVTVSKGDLCIEAFLGIPFAEPPTAELRFRRPLPKKPWHGVYNANTLPPSCMQNNSGNYYEPSSDTPMSEDCLYVNLWVPYYSYFTNRALFLKPILIFIYGGAFNIGSSNMKLYDGANLARKGDVIVVTLNYRVGAFGFMFANIEEADGNMGLLDQILAIEWVKANARAFGGDPDHIVLFGESAGAMAIGGHLSSPLARNLFKRAILQSGSPTMPLSLKNNTGLFQMTQRLSTYAGCAPSKTSLEDDPRKVVECLRNVSAKSIADAEGDIRRTYPVTFYPRTGDDYMPDASIRLLKRGIFTDTEILIGTNEAEGPFFLKVAAEDYFGRNGTNPINIPSKRFARNFLRTVLRTVGIGRQQEKEISVSYTDPIENGTSEAYLESIGNAVGDYFITCSTYFQAELHSLKSPVYYYVMKRRPSSTPLAEWMKMTHFDEVQYVFGNPLFEKFTPEEEAFSNRIMERWLAFAKTGNPNIPGETFWPRFHQDDQKYLEMSDVDVVRSGSPEEGRCDAWRDKHEATIDGDVLELFEKMSQAKRYQSFPTRMWVFKQCIEAFFDGRRQWFQRWIRTFHFW